ncbi:DUF485 domain-containing protein [Paraburkholderia tagetis]|uniref:DUF485 domain-containing protein n=1 Tax=Paraburkholderia tagetis TaxID=2913261 RepID=A0A9X1RQR3_9BURK|nr:DUF485 domain-containing protein [Paraburkholderia tagetis]MCG5074187.1 DUF485 domain-containing protein [Paraburkholderia tagetis]
MTTPSIDTIKAHPEYRQLIAVRRRFSFTLTALMIALYYGFILIVALAPHRLAHPLYAGATTSVGIIVGVGIIAGAISLTGFYVLRANRRFDPAMRALIAKLHGEVQA